MHTKDSASSDLAAAFPASSASRPWLTASTAQRNSSASREHAAHQLITDGTLPSVKLGRRRLIRHEAIVALLDSLEVEAS